MHEKCSHDDRLPIDRRSLLLSFVGTTVVGLAGCIGDGSNGDDDNGSGGDGSAGDGSAGDGTDSDTGGQSDGADAGESGGGGDAAGDGGDSGDGTDGSTDGENGSTGGDQQQAAGDAASEDYVDEEDGQVELTYGDIAALSNGIEVTAHGVSFETEMGEEVPETGAAFALVQIEAFNGGDEPARLPQSTDPGIYVLFEDRQVEPAYNFAAFSATEYSPYEGEEVQPGVRREGHILFEVAGGLDQSTVDFLWQDEIFVAENLEGAIDVRWAAD